MRQHISRRQQFVWLASYATDQDFDAERDDSSFDSAADLAEPRGSVLASLQSLPALKKIAVAELQDIMELTDEEFEAGVWELVKKEKGYQRWRYDNGYDTIHLIARRERLL